ncbi:AMP-binding protein [Actinomadura sp. WMMB 499]|uniref:AMP-binding protein n=1 Tax=Actinomadura sp. WMMB 499 TaxID=1219491 RepID=UPI001245C0E3|nr:AMP-binding protein [Actinomadura sp. WMMB 499]QFG22819.1 AMP-binding protein [Actinomadura sp. WMMB 499]
MTSRRDRLAWLGAAWRAGMLAPMPPRTLAAVVRAMRAYGALGAATAVGAARFGDRTAVVDDRGPVGYRDLDRGVNALATAWARRGIGPDGRVAILCRNHRGLLLALSAAGRLGAGIVLLNTDFAAPQLRRTVEEQGITALVHDAEFAPLVEGIEVPHGVYTAWSDGGACDLDELAAGRALAPPAPPRASALVILSSGTSGRPKGAMRSSAPSEPLALPGGILTRIPFRRNEAVLVAPPLFHGWGLTSATLALALGCTLVLHRRFDAERVVADLAERRCTALIAVPTMLSRVLAAPNLDGRDLSALRIIATGGGPLSAALTREATGAFGEVLYNFYGSTEASCISIATPADLAAAPGCAGTPPPGTVVSILDEDGRPVPPGTVGQVHVRSPTRFDGYTSGRAVAAAGAPLPIGDLGHVDRAGRLHIDGRADDMIVSGGENVHPAEIEELLAAHPDIAEAAVVGVPDEEFGQRLRACVVAAPGSSGGLDAEQVRKHVAANLARYKVPREVVFLDELPRTPTGKVVKRRLAAGS